MKTSAWIVLASGLTLVACSSADMAGVDNTLSKVPIADDSDTSDATRTDGNPQDFKSEYETYKNKGYSDSDAYNSAYAVEANEKGAIPDTSQVPKPK